MKKLLFVLVTSAFIGLSGSETRLHHNMQRTQPTIPNTWKIKPVYDKFILAIHKTVLLKTIQFLGIDKMRVGIHTINLYNRSRLFLDLYQKNSQNILRKVALAKQRA